MYTVSCSTLHLSQNSTCLLPIFQSADVTYLQAPPLHNTRAVRSLLWSWHTHTHTHMYINEMNLFNSVFQSGSVNYPVSITSAVCVVFGFILTVLAYVQYYEDVFCGELQLCRRCVHCCLPCLCPRVSTDNFIINNQIFQIFCNS